MIFDLTVLIFLRLSSKVYRYYSSLFNIRYRNKSVRNLCSERFIDKFLGLFGEAPAGEGLGVLRKNGCDKMEGV